MIALNSLELSIILESLLCLEKQNHQTASSPLARIFNKERHHFVTTTKKETLNKEGLKGGILEKSRLSHSSVKVSTSTAQGLKSCYRGPTFFGSVSRSSSVIATHPHYKHSSSPSQEALHFCLNFLVPMHIFPLHIIQSF